LTDSLATAARRLLEQQEAVTFGGHELTGERRRLAGLLTHERGSRYAPT
jgi:hypothetical protein